MQPKTIFIHFQKQNDMEKYKNISDYCENRQISVNEMKGYLFEAAMKLATSAAHVLTNEEIETVASPFHYFNDILESVE